jgi:uncharacterized CHY-type Zn-finger protein
MHPVPPQKSVQRTNRVLAGLTLGFLALGAALSASLWGERPRRTPIPLVDPAFLETTASRQSYSDLLRLKEDLSDFACYVCHEKKPAPLKFDSEHRVIVPEEHGNIVMAHGSHNRNNHCYNCHNENNLETLHIRDGRDIPFRESPTLCGSCHGPTYRDWEAGAHGRISGYWNKSLGQPSRLDCVNCHDPHSPAIPSRKPAPAPNPPHVERTAAPAH